MKKHYQQKLLIIRTNYYDFNLNMEISDLDLPPFGLLVIEISEFVSKRVDLEVNDEYFELIDAMLGTVVGALFTEKWIFSKMTGANFR